MDAKLIALEGIDGTGTTTQSGLLRDAVLARGEPCIATFEPTRGPIGSLIRLALAGRVTLSPPESGRRREEFTYGLLFAADRMDHLLNEIEPALHGGSHVVTDRYYLSSFAYQHLECDVAWLRQLNAHCRPPDVTFLLDAEPEVCLGRICRGRHHRDRYEQIEKLESIRTNYLEIAELLRAGGEQITVINAEQSVQAVHNDIMRSLDTWLGKQ
ncbi:MAG TPA: dTMP kinase [Planctomycetota bacterium]|nr:dTMP kinase [Planctomycetota bacterium]